MERPEETRRDFLRKAATAASVGATFASAEILAAAADESTVDESKILNFNPKMTYRPLGKTGFMISEISLGGHGGTTDADRVPVLEKAVELGINYVDNNIAEECDMYGSAMAKSSSAGRDKWFIGFASWPQKVTTEYEDNLTPEGMMQTIEARLRSYRTEMLDMWRPVGATWGEGQTKIPTMLMVSHKTLDMIVERVREGQATGQGAVPGHLGP